MTPRKPRPPDSKLPTTHSADQGASKPLLRYEITTPLALTGSAGKWGSDVSQRGLRTAEQVPRAPPCPPEPRSAAWGHSPSRPPPPLSLQPLPRVGPSLWIPRKSRKSPPTAERALERETRTPGGAEKKLEGLRGSPGGPRIRRRGGGGTRRVVEPTLRLHPLIDHDYCEFAAFSADIQSSIITTTESSARVERRYVKKREGGAAGVPLGVQRPLESPLSRPRPSLRSRRWSRNRKEWWWPSRGVGVK